MQKIVPHLWFDKEAKQAAEFYTSIFPESKINSVSTLHNTPSGDADVVTFTLWGHEFMSISAGPLFKFNPSISFMINFDPSRMEGAREKLDEIWNKLMDGGTALMPLDKYPFSEHYGWVQDKYGLTWQLILTNPDGEVRPPVIPNILFVGDAYGKAEEAVNFYLSVFKPSELGAMVHYGPGQEQNKEGTVMFSDFNLLGTWLSAMDGGGGDHKFKFNEAISFMVKCKDQEEIDYYWEKLSAVPESEQCGWLKDKFGVSWQITPVALGEMMSGDPEKMERVTQAFLKMKKFDLAELERAANGQ